MSSSSILGDLLSPAGRLGILHHWDADGICSAAEAIMWAEKRGIECDNLAPAIGDYGHVGDAVRPLGGKKPDVILLLDLAATARSMGKVASLNPGKTIWVDHHSNPPLPPRGVNFFHPGRSPLVSEANSWFLMSLLGEKPGLLSALGVCGDLGQRLLEAPIRGRVERVAAASGFSLEELFKLADLIDSNYRADDQRGVEEAPRVLLEGLRDPRGLLEVGEWVGAKARVDEELRRVMDLPVEEKGEVFVKTIETKMHLTSIVARKSAQEYRGKAKAVIVKNPARDLSPFYVRAVDGRLDFGPLIDWAREKGLSAGGKREVVGMLAPRHSLQGITEEVLEFLEAHP